MLNLYRSWGAGGPIRGEQQQWAGRRDEGVRIGLSVVGLAASGSGVIHLFGFLFVMAGLTSQ